MPRQSNFLGGELDPLFWGRTDLPLFQRGLRRMRNFFASKHGAAVSRPGTLYIGPSKNDLSDPNVRLVPFVYSDELAYVLEVGVAGGEMYFRFFREGERVLATYIDYDAQTVAFDTTAGNDLFGSTSLTHARIIANDNAGATGTLQIEVVSGPGFVDNETIANIAGAGSATANQGSHATTNYQDTYELGGGTFSGDLKKLKWAQTGAVLTLTHPEFPALDLTRVDEDEWTLEQTAFSTSAPFFDNDASPTLEDPLPAIDATHPGQQWQYWVTLSVRDAAGRRFETAAWEITEMWDGNIANPATPLSVPELIYVGADRPVTILTAAHIPLDPRNVEDLTYVVEAVNYYRGQGLERGWIGSTTLFGEFVDLGAEPNYAFPPPRGTLPFQLDAYVGDPDVDLYPSAVAFFQDRLCFGATREQPMSVWLSHTGNYRDFDLPLVTHHSGESLLFGLAALQHEEVRHLFPDAKLLAFTGASSWGLIGAQGSAIDFGSVDIRREDSVGASHVPPVKVEDRILFVRTKGTGVRALKLEGEKYFGQDVSAHSQHLFLGETVTEQALTYTKAIEDWAFAEDPWGLLWACRNDGVLLSLTHTGDEFGWARHDCDDARFLRVCAIPEGEEDAVYLLVQRTINGALVNCIERMASRVQRNNQDDDCCVDCAVKYVGDPEDLGTLSADDELAGKVLRIDVPHLQGEEVWVCGVDNIPRAFTVDDGTDGYGAVPGITLDEAFEANNVGEDEVTLYIGLKYTPELETLDAISSDTRQKRRIVERVGIELDQSTGVYAGPTFDEEDLVTSKPNTVAAGYLAPSKATALVSFAVPDKWSDSGKACVQQQLPLPVTVVGITRDIKFGD